MSDEQPADRTLSDGLPIGERVRSQGRTVGEGDFSSLTNLTWTTGELHVNRELMASPRGTEILGKPGERVLALQAVAALGVGLGWSNGLGGRLREVYATRVIRSISFEVVAGEPLFPGDTIWSESVLTGVHASGEPLRAILDVEHRIVNQRGELVATITQHLLFERYI
jgi:hypothetical protein